MVTRAHRDVAQPDSGDSGDRGHGSVVIPGDCESPTSKEQRHYREALIIMHKSMIEQRQISDEVVTRAKKRALVAEEDIWDSDTTTFGDVQHTDTQRLASLLRAISSHCAPHGENPPSATASPDILFAYAVGAITDHTRHVCKTHKRLHRLGESRVSPWMG